LLLLLLITKLLFAFEEAIIGEDTRALSFDKSVGRLRMNNSGVHTHCTATLIGKSCAITAGHCNPVFQRIGFDIPVKSNTLTRASKENTYKVSYPDRTYVNDGVGNDWAVIRLERNEVSGRYPGELRPIKRIADTLPAIGDEISITGYGLDSWQPPEEQGGRRPRPTPPPPGYVLYALLQQRGFGELLGLHRTTISHNVDTMGGNSGGAVVNVRTGEVIAIHTHGDKEKQINRGTLIPGNEPLLKAISACLKWEETSLPAL
jgi:V8-like Glu-specific endopeptidase